MNESADRASGAMTESEVLAALEDAGAILSGHFKLTSGRHSDTYVQCARVLEDPVLVTRLARAMAAALGDRPVDLVAAPAVGGIIIGFAVAQALGVRFIFSEREGGAMTFRRGFDVRPGERVLVVEDVVTTGGSVAEVIDLVRQAGGEPVAVASIIDRGGPKAFSVELLPLLPIDVASWDAASCGLCSADVPLYVPGSRALAK
jgi:orotate phosphoribosyltransferase